MLAMSYILFRYLHFLALFVLAGTIVIENMAIKPTITGEDARNLAKVDAAYGISAVLVLIFGLILWFGVGKPSDFYTLNPVFQIKVALFVLIGLVSIYPTVFLLKHRRSTATSIPTPALMRVALRVELVLLCVIPVLAFLMARGVGLSS